MGYVGEVSREEEQVNFNNQSTIIKNHMYKVLNNGQLQAICDHIETAIALIKTLEMNIDRMLCHSPFTIELNDSE